MKTILLVIFIYYIALPLVATAFIVLFQLFLEFIDRLNNLKEMIRLKKEKLIFELKKFRRESVTKIYQRVKNQIIKF